MKGQLSLFQLPPVHRGISWQELFGRTIRDVDAATRRQRWDELKQMSLSIEDRDILAEFECGEGCRDAGRACVHFNAGWCDRIGLPASFNPVVRGLGMACCGVGFQAKQKERA